MRHILMKTPVLHLLALGLGSALMSLAACGDSAGDDPRPSPEVTGSASDIRIVAAEDADLVLWISNQSFDDKTVWLEVAVDGVTVVADDFAVEGQHNWFQFPLQMSVGAHEITAESDSGAQLRESFRVPGDESRHAVIDHWGKRGTAELTWMFQREPLAFS